MNPTDLSAGPLAGLRVLDLSTMLAGPYGATILGDMGADVIKVESPYGDESRHLGPKRGEERGREEEAERGVFHWACSTAVRPQVSVK